MWIAFRKSWLEVEKRWDELEEAKKSWKSLLKSLLKELSVWSCDFSREFSGLYILRFCKLNWRAKGDMIDRLFAMIDHWMLKRDRQKGQCTTCHLTTGRDYSGMLRVFAAGRQFIQHVYAEVDRAAWFQFCVHWNVIFPSIQLLIARFGNPTGRKFTTPKRESQFLSTKLILVCRIFVFGLQCHARRGLKPSDHADLLVDGAK